MKTSTAAASVATVVFPLLLGACAGGSGGAGYNPVTQTQTPTPTPTPFTIGAPAPARPGNATIAVPGGPTIGAPVPNTLFDLTQTALGYSSTGISADAASNAGGTITAITPSSGIIEIKIPGLGIDVSLKDDGTLGGVVSTGQFVAVKTSVAGSFSPALAGLSYANLGNWVVYAADQKSINNEAFFVNGFETADASMPTSGSATYGGVGTVIGAVVVPNGNAFSRATLSGDSNMAANFATGIINGSFSNMVATASSGGAATPWNNVSFTGTIALSDFAGPTNTTSSPSNNYALGTGKGNITGNFYGPNAEELAGVWTLTDGTRSAIGSVAAGKVAVASDRRLKRDITPLRRMSNGIQLYSFRYFNDERLFVGVMAQDLLADPRFTAAVFTRPSGVLLVDYDRLGLAATTDMDAMREAGETAVLAYECLVTT